MRNGWSWIGWAIVAVMTSLPAWSVEPDPEEVRRRMEIYLREEKPAPVSKPAPAVDHDREAWQSAEKCGTAACFEAYLEDYPKGRYARMAKARLKPKPEPKPAPKSESTPRPTVATPTPRPTAKQRFTDNGDGTVTDNQTGLIWLKDANCFGEKDWYAAMDLAKRLRNGQCGLRDGSVAGRWRLPSKEEWEALIDEKARNPALPAGHPFTGVQPYYYWSSTTYSSDSTIPWFVGLGGGGGNWNASTSYVWPVRDGR